MTHRSAPHRPAWLLLLSLTGVSLGALSLDTTPASAQDQTGDAVQKDDRANPYGTGAGGAILLTNNGFGLGGYFRRELGASTSFLVEANLGAGKDDRELKFYQFGSGIVPNKRNYFLMAPIHLGAQHRLFSEHIEDNFRPYLHVSGGPTFGWEYPYFDDKNDNEIFDDAIDRRYDIFSAFPRGRLRFGLGGTVALGAFFGTSRKVTQGVRFGYVFNYFFDGVQLLEPDVKAAQSVFHSPVISIVFGKLF